MSTKKTKDALSILRSRREQDPELQRHYEEERVNYQIALAIRQAREQSNLTQSELAQRSGTTQSVISRLEDANYEGHSLSMLQRIANSLSIPLENLLTQEKETKSYSITLSNPQIMRHAARLTGWQQKDVELEEENTGVEF